jgi:hypothetical protein
LTVQGHERGERRKAAVPGCGQQQRGDAELRCDHCRSNDCSGCVWRAESHDRASQTTSICQLRQRSDSEHCHVRSPPDLADVEY